MYFWVLLQSLLLRSDCIQKYTNAGLQVPRMVLWNNFREEAVLSLPIATDNDHSFPQMKKGVTSYSSLILAFPFIIS